MSAPPTNPSKVSAIKRAKPFAANNASKKALESDGWTCCVVEKTIPRCFLKVDAYNFGDLLCCSPSRGIMLVQATGGTGASNFHARVRKLREEPRHAIWLASGGRIQVHSHETVKGSKKRKLRILEITALMAGDEYARKSKSRLNPDNDD